MKKKVGAERRRKKEEERRRKKKKEEEERRRRRRRRKQDIKSPLRQEATKNETEITEIVQCDTDDKKIIMRDCLMPDEISHSQIKLKMCARRPLYMKLLLQLQYLPYHGPYSKTSMFVLVIYYFLCFCISVCIRNIVEEYIFYTYNI